MIDFFHFRIFVLKIEKICRDSTDSGREIDIPRKTRWIPEGSYAVTRREMLFLAKPKGLPPFCRREIRRKGQIRRQQG